MKIAIVSGIDKIVSLESAGGIETWTANFAIENAKNGHEIDLFAPRGSVKSDGIKLIETIEKPVSEFYEDEFFSSKPHEFVKRKEQFMGTVYTKILLDLISRENNYDLIVDSCSYPLFSFNTKIFSKPVLIIGHFPVEFGIDYYIKAFGVSQNQIFVFPSEYQFDQTNLVPVSQKRVIPHGINLSAFEFNKNGGENVLWLSRIHERIDKGVREAIEVANKTNKILDIYATVEKSSEEFFNEKIRPLFGENINFNDGRLDAFSRSKIYGDSKIFLFPIQWEEAFGLVMIEAMACGTPCVAYARGSVPEVIRDGETGFIVNSSDDDIRGDFIIKKTGIEGLCEAVNRIYSMPEEEYRQMRKNCRAHVEKNFTVERMVDAYEEVYKQILANGK